MTECDKLLWQVIDEKTDIRDLVNQLHKFEYDTSKIRINEQEKANCAIDKDLSKLLKSARNNPNFNIQKAKAFKAISNEFSKPDDNFYKLLEDKVINNFHGKYFIMFLTEMLKIDINLFKNEGLTTAFIESHNNKLGHISVINDNPQITDYTNNVFNLTFPSPAPTPTAQIISGIESPTNFGNGLPTFPNIDDNYGGTCIHPLEEEKSAPPGLTKSPPRMKSSINSCNVTPERLKKQSAFDRYKEGFHSESKLHEILKEKYISLEEKSKKELELVTERYEAEKKLLQEQIYTFKTQIEQLSRINDFLMKSLDTQTKIAADK